MESHRFQGFLSNKEKLLLSRNKKCVYSQRLRAHRALQGGRWNPEDPDGQQQIFMFNVYAFIVDAVSHIWAKKGSSGNGQIFCWNVEESLLWKWEWGNTYRGASLSRRTTRTHGTLLMKMRQRSVRFSLLFSLNRNFSNRDRLRKSKRLRTIGPGWGWPPPDLEWSPP